MIAVIVDFKLVAGTSKAFMPLMHLQAKNSLALEAGCHLFDVCTDDAKPDKVFLYEVYEDRAAFDTHLQSVHYKEFDTAVSDMLADKQVRIMGHVHRPLT